jgi:ATP-binding cassette subfamily B protein
VNPAKPPLAAAVRHLWQTARAAAPGQLAACIALVLASGVADGLLVLWLALAVASVVSRHYDRALAFGTLLAGMYFVIPLCERSKVTLRKQVEERTALMLQAEQVRALLRPDELTMLESPDAAADLETLRRDRGIGGQAAGLLVEDIGFLARVIVSVVLLAVITPVLLLLLPVAAVTIRVVGQAEQHEQTRLRQCANQVRLARHLLHSAADPSCVPDLLTAPDAEALTRLQMKFRREHDVAVAAARLHAARLAMLGWVPFVLAAVAALAIAAYAAVHGHLDAARLMLVLLVVAQLVGQLSLGNELTRVVIRLAVVYESFLSLQRRVVDSHKTATTLESAPAQFLPPQLSDGIRLSGVCYAYPGGDLVLHGIDVWLRPGTITALVGENGSGKSTLARLLLGLQSPTAGEILVDGARLGTVPAKDWQRRVRASMQDFARFEFTAGITVGLGDLPFAQDAERVRRALTSAGADHVVDALPEGRQTPLGQSLPGGSELSRGQWQRLALARSRMRERVLLTVLDEPTASLDTVTESLIYNQVRRYPGTISVLVTHRLATTRHADMILVLADGRLVEQGTHEDLLQRRGKYHELYAIQASAYAQ